MPIRTKRTGWAAVALVSGSLLISAYAAAPALAARAIPAGSPCAAGSAAAVSATAFTASSTSATAAPSDTASPSDIPSPSDAPTSADSPSTSPSSSGATQSPSPSDSSSASPSKSPSPSPSPSPSKSKRAGALCLSVQIVRQGSSAAPGGTLKYSIWVWSTAAVDRVTVTVAASGKTLESPRYTLCPAEHNETCSLGSLPADQAFEVLVSDHVRSSATAGGQATLAVTAAGAGLSPAEAAITAVVSQAGTSPSPTTPVTLPPTTYYPTFPSTTVTPAPLTSLFPVVTPSPSDSGNPAAGRHRHDRRLAGVTSSSLPIDPRMIGGQLAGLAVLAVAITMVVARLSLRTAQPAPSAPAGATSQVPAVKASGHSITQTAPATAAPQPDAGEANSGSAEPGGSADPAR